MSYKGPQQEGPGTCGGCGQLRSPHVTSPERWVCINADCMHYSEPAAVSNRLETSLETGKRLAEAILDPPPEPAACGMCGGRWALEQIKTGEGPATLRGYCLDPTCPQSLQLLPPSSEPERGMGIKLDQGKPPIFTEFLMQFPDAIELVAWIGEQGSKAPGHVRSGWKQVEQGYLRYSDAFGRHILEEARRLTEEPESEDPDHDLLFQAATVAWNSMARLQILARDKPGAMRRIFGERLDTTREA